MALPEDDALLARIVARRAARAARTTVLHTLPCPQCGGTWVVARIAGVDIEGGPFPALDEYRWEHHAPSNGPIWALERDAAPVDRRWGDPLAAVSRALVAEVHSPATPRARTGRRRG